MKKLVVAAILAIVCQGALAQSFVPSGGFTATELLSLDFDPYGFGGFSVSSGTGYFFQQTDFGSGAEVRLRAMDLGTAAVSDLYSLPGLPQGGLTLRLGGDLWFTDTADFTNYALRKFEFATATVTTTGTVANLYALATAPGGAVFASHLVAGGSNRVSQITLATGALSPVLDAGSDFSGPLAFDPAGNLYYGTTIFADGKVRKFTASQVSAGGLVLGDGAELYDLGGSQYLDFTAGGLLHSISPFGSPAILSFLAADGSGQTVLGLSATGDYFAGIGSDGVSAFLAVVNGSGSSAKIVKVEPVPEPAAGMLCAAGAAFWLRRRRRALEGC